MAFWKQKYNRTDGFSLVEIVVAITILGFVAVPMLTGLLFSYQLNQRSDEKMQAQLAVSSAVETIMAEGYNPLWAGSGSEAYYYPNRFPDVKITATIDGAAYALHFVALDVNAPPDEETNELPSLNDIYVDTYARPYVAPTITDNDERRPGGVTDE